MEHYSKLRAEDIPEHPDLESALPSFNVYVEMDEDPTEKELSEAIDTLSNGKALDEDCLPSEFLKKIRMSSSRSCMHCRCYAGDNVRFLTQCRRLSPCIKTKVTRATVTITGEYLFFL